MDRDSLDRLLSGKIKLVRTEQGYTQDEMAEILGMSKKTLIQIEKGRTPAGWTNVVALCALFRDSEVMRTTLGDDPLEIIKAIAHLTSESSQEKTMGGKVWWREVDHKEGFRLQQNIISHHYRILDDEDYRWYSSFEKEKAVHRLEGLIQTHKKENNYG